MATKIKNRKPSKFPDKSEYAKGYSAGYRKGCEDTNDAKKEIKESGACDMTLLLLYLLKDKYKSNDEDIMQLHADIVQYGRMVADGFLTLDMIKTELQNVYNFEFEPPQ